MAPAFLHARRPGAEANLPAGGGGRGEPWRVFFTAVAELALALVLALYSGAAAQSGRLWLAALSAAASLALAGWVAVTLVPVLARRTALRWLGLRIEHRLTREGGVYLAALFIIALAALNTGNNLLFMVLASMLAGVLISGVLSQAVLSGVELRLELPEHIFAGRPVAALAELVNHKRLLPSFSLRLVSRARAQRQAGAAGEILTTPVYFPYVPRRETVQQRVELVFPRRGIYRQEALGLATRFPFGFLEKVRRVPSRLEAVVYPAVEPTEEFYEILPLVSGELESFMRGRGHDLYSIRDYQTSDSARHVDWKASARTGALQVREFAREDERRVLLVLDSFQPTRASGAGAEPDPVFERGVSLCASLAWHFHEIDAVLAFRAAGFETPMAPAGEVIYSILRHLATIEPLPPDAPAASLLEELAGDCPHVFKLVLTRRPRGSIPTSLWGSSYILFLDS